MKSSSSRKNVSRISDNPLKFPKNHSSKRKHGKQTRQPAGIPENHAHDRTRSKRVKGGARMCEPSTTKFLGSCSVQLQPIKLRVAKIPSILTLLKNQACVCEPLSKLVKFPCVDKYPFEFLPGHLAPNQKCYSRT